MKKTGWIITGIASATAAAATVYVLNKVKKHRLSEQQQHLIHLNDELDAPLTAMESMEDTDDKTIHTIVQDEDDQTIDMPELDPIERNAQIMREVKRMSIDEDQQDSTMDQDDQRIVDELQSVYSHLSRGFIVESISKCERFAKDFADRAVVTIKYHIAFDTTNDQLAFDQTIKSLGYTSEQGLLEDQMSVKSVITLKYVKLLSDVLTVANQVSACNGHLLGYEVE